MDTLASLLAGPRAAGSFVLRSVQDPPWSVHVQDNAALSIVAVMRGDPWVIPGHGEAVQLHSNDIAIIGGPDPYTFTDDPSTPVQVLIHPGARRTTPSGDHLPDAMNIGVRTWGSRAAGSAIMLIGKYQAEGQISQRLLRLLPTLLVISSHDQPISSLLTLLADETIKDAPGQEAVLDRLLDLLLVAVLRAWFARPEAQAPAWYAAHSDPVVGCVLRLMHDHPEHPWTVASLATHANVSRATLAHRFNDMVGEPPIAYLTAWRMDLAADLLRKSKATIGAVAQQVGYGSAFALSTAFKRAYGTSPQRFRARS